MNILNIYMYSSFYYMLIIIIVVHHFNNYYYDEKRGGGSLVRAFVCSFGPSYFPSLFLFFLSFTVFPVIIIKLSSLICFLNSINFCGLYPAVLEPTLCSSWRSIPAMRFHALAINLPLSLPLSGLLHYPRGEPSSFLISLSSITNTSLF